MLLLFREGAKNYVWELPEYYEDRKQVMMTLSDAQECTFKPILNKPPAEL